MTGVATVDESLLFDRNGARKYLTRRETKVLLATISKADCQTQLFCKLLCHTGCRISEALALTRRHLDLETERVIFRTLKRRKTVYRGVPVPGRFMRELVKFAAAHELEERLFPWCRQTGWRRIRALMDKAGIVGIHATPKGLRHQFGCHAVACGLPESLVGRLLGHANTKSTRVYTLVLGSEERALVRRMWERQS